VGGAKYFYLGKQQYLVWDTASRSTKRQDMLEIWVHCPFGAPGLRVRFWCTVFCVLVP